MHKILFLVLTVGAALFWADPALAQALTLDLGQDNDGTVTGRIVQLVLVLTVLSLAPGILIMMTSFTRIVIVLSFVRTAIGIQQTPPNMVLVSLAMFLTFFIMTPTFEAAYEQGIGPLINEEVDELQGFQDAMVPFKEFMARHTRPEDLALFTNLSPQPPEFETPADIPPHIGIPAFMISELRRAFEIGFMLFLPFLIIDLVTASILMSMGMLMLPPIIISLPFKIIFFVIVDGWYLIAGSLLQSFDVVAPITNAAPPG